MTYVHHEGEAADSFSFHIPDVVKCEVRRQSDTADSEIRWLAIGWPLFENFSSNELWWVKLQLLSSLTLPGLTCRSFSFGYVYEYCTHHLAIANDLIWREKWVLFLLFCTVVFSRIWVFFFNWTSRLTFSIALHSNVAWFSDVVFLKSKYMYSRPAPRASFYKEGGIHPSKRITQLP